MSKVEWPHQEAFWKKHSYWFWKYQHVSSRSLLGPLYWPSESVNSIMWMITVPLVIQFPDDPDSKKGFRGASLPFGQNELVWKKNCCCCFPKYNLLPCLDFIRLEMTNTFHFLWSEVSVWGSWVENDGVHIQAQGKWWPCSDASTGMCPGHVHPCLTYKTHCLHESSSTGHKESDGWKWHPLWAVN